MNFIKLDNLTFSKLLFYRATTFKASILVNYIMISINGFINQCKALYLNFINNIQFANMTEGAFFPETDSDAITALGGFHKF